MIDNEPENVLDWIIHMFLTNKLLCQCSKSFQFYLRMHACTMHMSLLYDTMTKSHCINLKLVQCQDVMLRCNRSNCYADCNLHFITIFLAGKGNAKVHDAFLSS